MSIKESRDINQISYLSIYDKNNFKTDKSFELALYNTSKNIKNKLNGYPTVLFTGGGYHIYQPVYIPTALEYITEFSKFDRPSEQFLRFAKDFLSNGKADKQNNPSFRSCLLRIPGSVNSKYGNKVTFVKKWNSNRSPITLDLLEEFRIYSIQKKIDRIVQQQKILNKKTKKNYDPKYYTWIDHLLQTPIPDYRKNAVSLILAPYLINIKKFSYSESFEIINEWLSKCNSLKQLDQRFEDRIKRSLKTAMEKKIPPMKLETLREKNSELLYIKEKNVIMD